MGTMDTSEILFTRQRHEAERAGLHYDIRLVHGDVAYSWATKLDMPKPGESIILHQQPIHDRGYALSKKVVIPSGQYGGGTTYLDFVRKAHLKKSDDGSYFTLTTKDGKEKYLLKHIPQYGDGQWLFKNLTGIGKHKEVLEALKKSKKAKMEKKANIFAGAIMGHLAQNAATNVGLRSKLVAKHLANSFATGYQGKVPTGIAHRAAGAVMHAVTPDISIASKHMNRLGQELKQVAPDLTKKDHLALRMVSEGRFSDVVKHNLHQRPGVNRILQHISDKHGVDLPGMISNGKTQELEKLWNDKNHPLLSNISKNLSRGKPFANSKPGTIKSTGAVASSLGLAAVEPGAGAVSLTKHLASSSTVKSTSVGKKVSGAIEKFVVKDPVRKGWQEGANYKEGVGTKLYEHIVSPTSAHLHRTSAAISAAVPK